MNIRVLLLQISVFVCFRQTSSNGASKLQSNSVCNFVPQSCWTHLHFHQWCSKVPFPHPPTYFSYLFNNRHSHKCELISNLIFIFIFLMSDVEVCYFSRCIDTNISETGIYYEWHKPTKQSNFDELSTVEIRKNFFKVC